jgi:nicotinate-nucleotide adenylyltransferase
VRIGILGGTFNPPHLAHLVCAQEAYLQLELERVLFVPAAIPPHKAVEDEPGAHHRLELCRLAITGDETRFGVSDLEIARPGPSYTVDTLIELQSRAPDNELFLIVGADIAAGLPEWHEPERVLSLATLTVAQRRGTSPAAVQEALGGLRGGERSRFFEMPTIGLSSTMIRDRVRSGVPIRYFVPEPVSQYIDHHRLYRSVAHQ